MKLFKKKEDFNHHKLEMNQKVGFIPTMGALHKGHLQLIKEAQKENDIIIVSIFVNPLQFNHAEDFEKYPNTFESDLQKLQDLKVDILFNPEASYIYSDQSNYQVIENNFSKVLCGKTRPGHFEGVLTVLTKLFNIIKPHNVYMGKKDFQQYLLVKQMVESFFMDINIIGVETVRDEYGLALSSRNLRLSEEGINKARKVNQIVQKLKNQDECLEKIEVELTSLEIKIDYLENINQRIFIAFFVEGIRLIDNFSLEAKR